VDIFAIILVVIGLLTVVSLFIDWIIAQQNFVFE